MPAPAGVDKAPADADDPCAARPKGEFFMFKPLQLAWLLAAIPATAAAQSTEGGHIVLTPAQPAVTVGQTVKLQGQAVDAAGQPIPGAQLRFNGGIFVGELKPDGTLIGGAPGILKATVTAVVPGQKPIVARYDIPVRPTEAARIALEAEPQRLLGGQKIALRAHVFSGEEYPRVDDRVDWTSSAPKVAAVGADGVLSAVSPGTATITATSGKASRSFKVEVSPAKVASIAVTPGTSKVRTGDVIAFKVLVKDAAGKEVTGLTPTWTFASGAGQMRPDGKFVAYEEGDYAVTALVGGHVVTATVHAAPRDVRVPSTVIGSFTPATESSEVWAHPDGKTVYLSSFDGVFYPLDVSDPTKPTLSEAVKVNARMINDVMTSEDGKVLVATREGAPNRKNGIEIYTLDDPLHPKSVAEFVDPVTSGVHSAYVNTQAKYGRFVYLTADGQGRLYIVNIDDPAHPKQVATWETPRTDSGRYLHDLMVVDGILYMAYLGDGMVMLDVGNGMKGGSPSNPKYIASIKYDMAAVNRRASAFGRPTIGGTHTVWRHRNYVFITDEILPVGTPTTTARPSPDYAWGSLQVVDVSDMEHPKIVAWYNPEIGGAHNVWVKDDILYMGTYNGGFRAFDVSGELIGDLEAQGRELTSLNPADPKGWKPNATFTWGVVVKGDNIYVTDINNGLSVVRLEPKVTFNR
jgi:hypothetical protein